MVLHDETFEPYQSNEILTSTIVKIKLKF